MECDKDFIFKYQTLLENEKRRLIAGSFNLKTNDEENKVEMKESQEDDESEDKSKDCSDKELQKQSTTVFTKQEIVTDVPKKAKCESNLKARADAMEHWVTDSFYTSFPSFKKQDLIKNTLADDRREDYQKYLAEVSNKKLLDGTKSRKRTEGLKKAEIVFSQAAEKQSFSPRNKLLNDLKHSDLAYNFHSPDAIQERNQKISIERTRRKIELQKELIRQIEEKKLEFEKLRAKEKEEDEILQRRLENQIKSFQLAEELNKKNTEKVLVANPIHKTDSQKDAIPKSENNAATYESVDIASGNSVSERGTRNTKANNDRQIYKFFSNSAPRNDTNANYYNHPSVGFYNISPFEPDVNHVPTTIQHSSQQCTHCRRPVPTLCSSCYQDNLNRLHYCCNRCNLLQNMDVCSSCHLAWVQSWNHNRFTSHTFPHGEHTAVNNCSRHNRPQILEITYKDHSSQTTKSMSPYSYNDHIVEPTHVRLDKPHMITNALNHNSSNGIHSSIDFDENAENREKDSNLSNVREKFSTSKDDEILELKRKNDILIAKYARNYASLRKKQTNSNEFETDRQYFDDSFPLPLMRQPVTTTALINSDIQKNSRQNSQAVRKLEYKWEIPVVQKQVMSNNPPKVLTQVGAIAKQLQLEKLNFDN